MILYKFVYVGLRGWTW